MAKKKQSKKTKKSKFPKILIILIVLVVIGAIGFLGFRYYKISNTSLPLIEEMEEKIDIPDVVTDSFVLPKTMDGYDNISVDWSTSNIKVIDATGKVERPSYLDGDKLVTITATYNICDDDALAKIFFKVLKVESKYYTYKVLVKAKEALDEEKVDLTIASFIIPEVTNTSIKLRTEMSMFDSVNITWSTSNESIITSTGEKVGNGEAILSATVSSNEVSKTVNYNVTMQNEEILIVESSENFDGFPNVSNFDKGINTGENGWTVVNGISQIWEDEEAIGEMKYVVLKSFLDEDKQGSLTMNYDVEEVSLLSFYYQLNEAYEFRNNIKIDVYYSVDSGVNFTLLDSISIVDKEEHLYEKAIPTLEKVRFKIVAHSDVNQRRVDIDDLEIKRAINEDDIKEWLEKNTLASVTRDYALPLTTIYGGSIAWSSSNSNIMDENGIVTRSNESQKVTLTASITGILEGVITKEIEITVAGYENVTPVEVYFIDLGKYGQSDCGESIYIKANSFDILIDAGDRFETSSRAIEEVLNNYSEDKVLEYIIATHPDSDHIGGMKNIFTDYEVLNLIQFVGSHTSGIYQNYKSAYEAEGLNSICSAVDALNNTSNCTSVIQIADEVTLTVIDTKHYQENLETNARSVVTILEAYGTRVLLTGDADNKEDKKLESSYMNDVGDIDILKAVHHATNNGTTTEFLKVVNPEVVIICNGNYFGNKHGHPTPGAINRIYEYNSKIAIYAVAGGNATADACSYNTSYKCEITDPMVDRNGTIKITITETGYDITSEYYGDSPLELSSTIFWKENSERTASYSD